MTLSADEFPWRVAPFFPDTLPEAPTLLTRDELHLISWLARESASIPGDVCELGPFFGGSTTALAYGIKHSAAPDRRLYAYDRFDLAPAKQAQYLPEEVRKLNEGRSFLEAFNHYTREFSDIITPVKGEIGQAKWMGDGKIGFLFIDASKSLASNDVVLTEFFTKLSDGAIVVQQDYLYDKVPWVIHTMEVLSGAFERIGIADHASVAFKMTRQPTAQELQSVMSDAVTPEGMIASIEAVLPAFDGHRDQVRLRKAIVNIRKFPEARADTQYSVKVAPAAAE